MTNVEQSAADYLSTLRQHVKIAVQNGEQVDAADAVAASTTATVEQVQHQLHIAYSQARFDRNPLLARVEALEAMLEEMAARSADQEQRIIYLAKSGLNSMGECASMERERDVALAKAKENYRCFDQLSNEYDKVQAELDDTADRYVRLELALASARTEVDDLKAQREALIRRLRHQQKAADTVLTLLKDATAAGIEPRVFHTYITPAVAILSAGRGGEE